MKEKRKLQTSGGTDTGKSVQIPPNSSTSKCLRVADHLPSPISEVEARTPAASAHSTEQDTFSGQGYHEKYFEQVPDQQ